MVTSKHKVAVVTVATLAFLNLFTSYGETSDALGGGVVFGCRDVPIDKSRRKSTTESPKNVEVPKVRVYLHLMEAELDVVPGLTPAFDVWAGQSTEGRNLHAPKYDSSDDHAVSLAWVNAIKDNGLFNDVANIWLRNRIDLELEKVERCKYVPSMLRLDGTARDPCVANRRACSDAVFFPEDPMSMPWRLLSFRTINKLFTDRHPQVLHVVAWWWMGETAVVRRSEGEGEKLTPALYGAYSRAAGRGGPAVWMSTYGCLPIELPKSYQDEATRRREAAYALLIGPERLKAEQERKANEEAGVNRRPDDRKACARLLAHEIGHALTLHHVQDGDVSENVLLENLMLRQATHDKLDDDQKQRAVDEARRSFK